MMNSEASFQTAASASTSHPSSGHHHHQAQHVYPQNNYSAHQHQMQQPMPMNGNGVVHPSPMPVQYQQQQQHQHQQAMYNMPSPQLVGGGGGMSGTMMNNNGATNLYSNLNPSHYRYGATPPAPPPGPLSYSNTSRQRQNQAAAAAAAATTTPHHLHGGQQHLHANSTMQNSISSQYYHNAQSNFLDQTYQNVVPPPAGTTAQRQSMSQSTEHNNYLSVSEPDEDFVSLDVEDDEQYYRPFSHAKGDSASRAGNAGVKPSMNEKAKTKKKTNKVNSTARPMIEEETKPVDLLASLLGDHARQHRLQRNDDDDDAAGVDISIRMEHAAAKSRRARSMTTALAAKQNNGGDDASTSCSNEGTADNDLYVATSNAHTEAAISYQIVYRTLLGLQIKNNGDDPTNSANNSIVRQRSSAGGRSTLSPSEELAKSMLILAGTHARMAKSLGTMGVKWNMGKVDSEGRMTSKDSTIDESSVAKANDKVTSDNAKNGKQAGGRTTSTLTRNNSESSSASTGSSVSSSANNETDLQHERLRMAVRGALDTGNHEEDMTNSTFLARSTVMNASVAGSKKKVSPVKTKNRLAGMGLGRNNKVDKGRRGDNGGGVNPVDDLMKLENELRNMDMALEMGNSVASLGANTAGGQSFCVVPPGSSYMSSSNMWSQHQHAKPQQHVAKPKNGMTNVRSRNHLQNFIGGNGNKPSAKPASTAQPPASPQQQQQQGLQITPGNPAGLDQSWWGGGQGSILASSAIGAATASQQRPSPNGGAGNQNNDAANQQHQTSTNTKQLVQLMDSLKRLGDENAQLMREVEDAKAARAEAKSAKEMVAKFKTEYTARFGNVKKALEKYPQQLQQSGAATASDAADNPVTNSAYMKSTSQHEIQKRDAMIKQLSANLKKERDEVKKKDGALQKYEAFYREVKARSADKARQRQQAQQQQKQQMQQKKLQQQQKQRP